MKRDIEIVMINALSLFGNEKVMPSGPLREPLDALARADIVVIHHANLV
jgi:tetraacyldisaccharide 4'-kinase